MQFTILLPLVLLPGSYSHHGITAHFRNVVTKLSDVKCLRDGGRFEPKHEAANEAWLRVMGDAFPSPYRIFFLYVEPISALAGAYYAAIHQSRYLLDLVSPIQGNFTPVVPDTPTRMGLFQLANLYLLFALNEHLVLSSTSSLKTWKRLLFCLLVADFGHLATMIPAGPEIFWNVWKWNAMAWGSIGFVYLGAMFRLCFLAGVGLGDDGLHARKPKPGLGRVSAKASKMG